MNRHHLLLALTVWAGFGLLCLLAGCGNPGPTEADMAGCAVRSGGPPLSVREVADCAVDRAEIRHRRESAIR
jgi:hypothetical protein